MTEKPIVTIAQLQEFVHAFDAEIGVSPDGVGSTVHEAAASMRWWLSIVKRDDPRLPINIEPAPHEGI